MIKDGKTVNFEPASEKDVKNRDILCEVYRSLSEKGYDPINQIVGYLLSEDPTYITNYNNARAIVSKLDRDEVMGEMVRLYLGISEDTPPTDIKL